MSQVYIRQELQSLRQTFIHMPCTEAVLSGETRKGIRERKGKDLPRMWF